MGSNWNWDEPFASADITRVQFIELDQLFGVIRVDRRVYRVVAGDGHRTIKVWSKRLNRNIDCHQFETVDRKFFSVLDRDLAHFDSSKK